MEVKRRMRTIEGCSTTGQDPLGYLRDLALLTSLPLAWEGRDRHFLAESLVEVLGEVLALDLAWVWIKGIGIHAATVTCLGEETPEDGLVAELSNELRSRLDGNSPDAGAALLLAADGHKHGPIHLCVTPLAPEGELGVLAAASRKPGFPTDKDRLLIATATNQAIAALRHLEFVETAGQAQGDLTELLEGLPVGLHWLGPDGTILYASQVQLELLGYPARQYVGHSIRKFHVDPGVAEDMLRRLHAGEELKGYEARMQCRDGSIRHVAIDARGKWDGDRFVHAQCFVRDITDQRWTDETLRFFSEGEADYTCIACWDGRDLVLESASEGFTRVTGYTLEEFSAQLAVQVIHPDDIMSLLHDAERLLQGEIVNNEVRIIRKDGEVRCLRYLAEPMSELGDARFLRVRGAAQDVTERKLGTDRVYEAERRFRQMAESITEVFWLTDPWRTQIFYCSPAYEAIWGRPCESLLEHPYSLFDSVLPEDRELFVAALERQSKGEATDVEYRIVRSDGSVRTIRDRGYPIRDQSGEVYRVAGVADDVTQRKRAEETSRFLARASASLAALSGSTDTLQRIASLAVPEFADWCAVDIQAEDGSLRRLAVAHRDPSLVELAREIFDRYPPRDSDPCGASKVLRTGKAEWAAAIPESLLEGVAHDPRHLRLLRELGLKSYVCVPLCGRNGVFGVLTFLTAESGRVYDADDLRAAEDLANRAVVALENANLLAELQAADRRKDEFLAMLAHELRNPLAPIRNAARILRNRVAALPELGSAVGVIDRQVKQMSRLVDDLLDVSRISKGQIIVRKARVELSAVINSAIEASRPLIEAHGHELSVSLPPEAVYLDADETRLGQVLLNLLNNAAKYTPEGGRIWLSAECESERVMIRVRDNGIGIPREMLSHIFEMFTQVNGSPEDPQGGLGIGLTLARRLVEMHGGTLEAHSAGAGTGSEFVVHLPVAAVGPNEAPPGPGRELPAVLPGTCRSILVADDNRDAVETMAELLEVWGYEVHIAHDGVEAVRQASARRPDVVLLDIGMPGLSGHEAARRIREELGSEVVLIAATGWGQEEDRRRSSEAGFNYHLTKPIDLDALRELLSSRGTLPAAG